MNFESKFIEKKLFFHFDLFHGDTVAKFLHKVYEYLCSLSVASTDVVSMVGRTISSETILTLGKSNNQLTKEVRRKVLSRDCDGCGQMQPCRKRYGVVEKGNKVYCPDGTAHLVDGM